VLLIAVSRPARRRLGRWSLVGGGVDLIDSALGVALKPLYVEFQVVHSFQKGFVLSLDVSQSVLNLVSGH